MESDFDNCAVCIEGYKANDVVRILPCRYDSLSHFSVELERADTMTAITIIVSYRSCVVVGLLLMIGSH